MSFSAADLPWPLTGHDDLRERLVSAYSTGRGYHDLRHLSEVLARLDDLGFRSDVEVVLAAWFHDAVYDGSDQDEERSARLAETELDGVPDLDVAEVARLVRMTATHDPDPADTRGCALSDADLAILAAEPERYAEYAAGVRADFAAVPDDLFRQRRLALLEELAGRDSLFLTAHARREWEPRARENLASEIDQLRGP